MDKQSRQHRQDKPLTQRVLHKIEGWGNALPHPTMLFVYLCVFVIGLSWLAEYLALAVVHPVTGDKVVVVNLLSVAGLHRILANMVTNFTQFAPVGPVLVVMLGLGIAERSGLVQAVLKGTVLRAPAQLLTFIVVLTGVLSSIAVDSGYVVMIPLAGIIFLAAGRHPLAGISTEAAQLLDESYQVSVTANYYFIIASTFLITGLATWVTERYICPLLGEYTGPEKAELTSRSTSNERKALRWALLAGLVMVGLVVWGLFPANGFLRDSSSGSIVKSPFMSGLIPLIAISTGIMGSIYGYLSGRFNGHADIIDSMEQSIAVMATYIVLMFFAAQFVNFFSWTQLGLLLAVGGAELLTLSGLGVVPLMLGFILFCAFSNLFIGSASAKWAIMAPIFIPMFMLHGVGPEVVQAAYRVGDSSTNIITPLMPYFALVFAFMKQYDSRAGVGTIMTLMLPYSVVFLVGWGALLSVWLTFSLPLGP